MKKIRRYRPIIIAVIVFIVMSVASTVLLHFFIRNSKNDALEKAKYVAESQVSELERALSSYIQAADTLRILIVDSNGKINDFDRTAQQLYQDDPAYRSIQLAPDGNVQYVYPLEGNEDAFGDLFDDPDRKTEAEYARDTGEITLAGPFELYQGGMGIVVRQPIYLEQNGGQQFWGFAIVVLNVPEIFDMAQLDSLERIGYQYELSRIHPDTGKKQVILNSTEEELNDPVKLSFDVPGSTWTFCVSCTDGWVKRSVMTTIFICLMCITFLMAFLVYALLRIEVQRVTITEISLHDNLTELYNDRKMYDIIRKLTEDKTSFTMIYMDIDRFKSVNDTYGHGVGDLLLRKMAAFILSVLNVGDYAFRIGGDEFVILLKETENSKEVMQSLEKSIESPVMIGEYSIKTSISYGWAEYPQETEDIEELMKLADARMYEMKNIKKTRI